MLYDPHSLYWCAMIPVCRRLLDGSPYYFEFFEKAFNGRLTAEIKVCAFFTLVGDVMCALVGDVMCALVGDVMCVPW